MLACVISSVPVLLDVRHASSRPNVQCRSYLGPTLVELIRQPVAVDQPHPPRGTSRRVGRVEPPAKISDPPAAIKKRKGGRLSMTYALARSSTSIAKTSTPPNEI